MVQGISKLAAENSISLKSEDESFYEEGSVEANDIAWALAVGNDIPIWGYQRHRPKDEWASLITSIKHKYPQSGAMRLIATHRESLRERVDIKDLYSELCSEINELKVRLETLESRSYLKESDLLKEKPASDPYIEWCANNIDKIRSVPNSYLAIDIEKDEIVVAESDQLKFTEKLNSIPKERRKKLYRVHSSTLV